MTMCEKSSGVEVTRTIRLRVHVPDNCLADANEDPIAVAKEFALEGQTAWPEYVLKEDANDKVESVREIVERACAGC